MTGFKSPFARRSALVLTLTGGALGLFSAKSAKAQQFDPNLYCSQNQCGNQTDSGKPQLGKAYLDTFNSIMATQSQKEHSTRSTQIVVDTPENRRLVSRIYTATTTTINKALVSNGVDAAKLLIQHPENSPALTAIVKRELHEGNLILAAYAMGDALSDANDYINNGRKGAMPTVISPQDMTDNINNVQKGRQNNQQYTSESKLLADASTNKSIGHFSSIAGGFIVRTINNSGTQISLASVPQAAR